jgi:hypothetical protein
MNPTHHGGQHPIKKPEHRKVLRVHEKFFRF